MIYYSLNEHVDFTKIQIQLLSQNSELVDTTLCSSKGQFILPISKTGHYKVSIASKQGLQFGTLFKIEPTFFAYDLTDINKSLPSPIFKFMGFSIQGYIPNLKISLDLALKTQKDEIIKNLETRDYFQFDNLDQGIYSIYSLNDSFDYKQNLITCEIQMNSPQNCYGDIILSGFPLKGQLINEFRSDWTNTIIFLYGSHYSHCNIKNTLPQPTSLPYLCYTDVLKDGSFSFPKLSNGDYILYVADKDGQHRYDIQEKTVVIFGESFEFNWILKEYDFYLQGKVRKTDNKGISGVRILIDGEYAVTTDSQGNYQLGPLVEGIYSIEAEHEHYYFQPEQDIKLHAGLQNLPDLVVSRMHVCGQVVRQDNSPIMIKLESKYEQRVSLVDQFGKYCFEVKQGQYKLQPEVSSELSQIFIPAFKIVDVMHSYIDNVNFDLPKVAVSGKVVFLENNLSITIINLKNKSFKKSFKVLDGIFIFNDILKGTYEVELENAPFCWKKTKYIIEVKSQDINNLVFEQIGFKLRYSTPIDISAQVTDERGNTESFIFKQHESYICTHQSGVYTVKPDPCLQFESSSLSLDILNNTLLLKPLKYRLQGALQIVLTDIESKMELIELIPLKYNMKLKDIDLPLIYQNSNDSQITFTYSIFVEGTSSQNLSLQETDFKPSNKNLQNLLHNLFSSQTTVSVPEYTSCPNDLPTIRLEPGYFLKGTQNLPKIKLGVAQNGKITQYIDIDTQEFIFGPFPPHSNYSLKPIVDEVFCNTSVTQLKNDLSFQIICKQLYSVSIQFLDNQKNPIPQVSMTAYLFDSQEKYTAISDDMGNAKLEFLKMGDYLLRINKSEWIFDQEQQVLELKEHFQTIIIGQQVLFGIKGQILDQNHQPIIDVKVSYHSDKYPIKNEEKFVMTNEEGIWEIRGLKKGEKGLIRVQSEFVVIGQDREVQIIGDIFNIDFVVFKNKFNKWLKTTLQFDPMLTSKQINNFREIEDIRGSLVFELYKNNELQKVSLKTIHNYFEIRDLDQNLYELKVFYSFGKQFGLVSQIIHYNLEETNHAVIIIKSLSDIENQQKYQNLFSSTNMGGVVFLFLIMSYLIKDYLTNIYSNIQRKLKSN